MKRKTIGIILLASILVVSLGCQALLSNVTQIAEASISMSIARMDGLPSVATDYEYKDWKQTAINYVDYILDNSSVYSGYDSKGNSLAENPIPVNQLDIAKNIDAFFEESGNVFWGIKSYLGLEGGGAEGINCIAAVLTGAQVGLDMTNYSVNGQQPRNYVRDMVAFYQAQSGENVVLNSTGASTGGSFWYTLLPGCLFVNLYEYYPQETYLKEIIVEMGKSWMQAVDGLGGANCDFSDVFGFNVSTGEATYGNWKEPDAAAGIAYILYGAYAVSNGDEEYGSYSSQFLTKCMWAMDYLDNLTYSPFYEVLTFLAPPIAAKLNALHGKNYDIAKYINWTLDGSSKVRHGWGMINESWGNKHTYGLMGSLSDGGGYAFTMNTFDAAWGFLPLVKYDTRFANSIGKWILNASNAARYFYGENYSTEGEYITDTMSDGTTRTHWSGYYQSSNYFSSEDPESGFIAYEGLRKYRKGFHWTTDGKKTNFTDKTRSPYASGDSLTYWDGNTDFGMYGSSHVGMFGASISATNVTQVLRIDLNALDYFGAKDFPTYMYYNPYDTDKEISYTKTSASNRLYDAVNKKFITTSGSGTDVTFIAKASVSTVIVELPENGEITTEKGVYYLDGKYVATSRSSLTGTVEQYSDDNEWVSVSNGDKIKNKVRIKLNCQIDSSTSLSEVSITMLGKQVYSSKEVPTDYIEIDVANNDAIRSGSGTIVLSMKLKNGGEEKYTLGVSVTKSKMEQAVIFNSAEDQSEAFSSNKETWNSGPDGTRLPYDCNVTTEGDGTKFTAAGSLSYASAFSKYFTLDLSRNPILEFGVTQTSSQWALKVYVKGGSNVGYYLIRDTDSTGRQSIDIMEKIKDEDRSFNKEGIQQVAIWILPTGNVGCSVTIEDISIYYFYDAPVVDEPKQYEWGFEFTPGYLNLWENCTDYSSDGLAEASYTSKATTQFAVAGGKTVGAIASPNIYSDITRNPVFKITVGEVTGSYSVGVLFEGDTNVYKFASGITGTAEQTFIIPSLMKKLFPGDVKSGMNNIKILIILDSADSKVTLKQIETYYQLTEWGVTVSGEMFDEWSGNRTSSTKGTITALGNATNDYRIANPDSSSNVTSSRGACGKFELNLDRNPQVTVAVADSLGKWSLGITFFDEGTRYELTSLATSKNTQKTVNILDALYAINPNFSLTGVQSVYLQVDVTGGQNYVDVRKVITSYSEVKPAFDKGTVLSGRDITSWNIDESLNTQSYIQNGVACIRENLAGSAAIYTSAVKVAQAKNPTIVINTSEISGALKVYAVINNESYLLTPKKGYTQSGDISIDVMSKLAEAGYSSTQAKADMSFKFECEGVDSIVKINSVRFIYKLNKIEKIAIDGDNISWQSVSGASYYKVEIANSQNEVVKTIEKLKSTEYNVASLALTDGIYKITVTPLSENALSGDSTSQGFKQGNVQSITLDKISAIEYDGMTIRFDAVASAQAYLYKLVDVDNDQVVIDETTTTNNYIDLSEIGLPNFNYKLQIRALGDEVAYISSEYSDFAFATPTVARYTGKVLTTCTPVNNNAFATLMENGSALLQLPTGGNWGEIGTSAFNLDMDKNPIWHLQFGNVTHGYYLRMYIDGQIYYITDNVADNKDRWIDIVGTLREREEAPESVLTGTHSVRFCFGITGMTPDVANPTVEIKFSRVFTVSDGYVSPVLGELVAPSLTVKDNLVEWNSVENAKTYLVTVSNEYGVLYSTTTEQTNVDLSFLLQADTYTVTVVARGDKYYDSDVGSIEYIVIEEPTPEPKKNGCGSTISGLSLYVAVIIGSILAVTIRKKEEN